MANEDKGFWLIHSVPGFPPEASNGLSNDAKKFENYTIHNINMLTGSYAYPSSGKENGQSFLCISTNMLSEIGKQFQFNEIIVYQKNLPQHLSSLYQSLFDAANGNFVKSPPYNNLIKFKSIDGIHFTSFAKSQKWNKGKLIYILNNSLVIINSCDF